MLTDGIATTQPRQKSSMCLARRCLMNSVLGINKNPLSTQKSPPCKMPRKERFIDETHFVTMLERDERKDIVFSKEIRDRARKEGKERMSDKAIKKYVIKLYSLSAFKPRKFVNGKLMQASRFKHIKLSSAVVGDSTNTMRIHGVPVQVMRKTRQLSRVRLRSNPHQRQQRLSPLRMSLRQNPNWAWPPPPPPFRASRQQVYHNRRLQSAPGRRRYFQRFARISHHPRLAQARVLLHPPTVGISPWDFNFPRTGKAVCKSPK